MKLSNVTQFMADTRENIEQAVAGDIIGYMIPEIIKLVILI